MNIIKVDAIGSTNTFLKELCQSKTVQDYTVVVADNQIQGRGQVGAFWESQPSKNLTFSILVRHKSLSLKNQFRLNKIVSLALLDVLKQYLTQKVTVKWPNDIMAERQKICGILIENSITKSEINHSIIGVGLNVNQEVFTSAPNATSMKLLSKKSYDLDQLLNEIIISISEKFSSLEGKAYDVVNDDYRKYLYRLNKPQMFEANGQIFLGKIIGVTEAGLLKIENSDDEIIFFDLKEIKLLNK